MVGFVDNDNFESLFRCCVDLLRLRNLLEKILYDHTVVVAHVTRCNFEVIYGGDNIEFELSIRSSLENACVDLDLFDTGAVQFFQRSYNPGLLASARGSVDEQMWEISALSLGKQ